MTNSLKIGYLSDLHLEGSNMTLNNPGWDVLVLAGDISADFAALERFFQTQIPDDIPIIYTPGNHEFEGKRFDQTLEYFSKFETIFPNVKFLYNKSFSYKGVKFIGSTLWSNFEGHGVHYKDEAKKWAKVNVFDFNSIFVPNKNKGDNKMAPSYVFITPDQMEQEFNKCYDFLKYELRQNPTDEVKFVITHFAPHPKSTKNQFKKQLMSSYWVNNVEELLGFSDFWVHGHVHDTFNYEVEATKILCNPRGYSKTFDLSPNTFFEKNIILEVPIALKSKIKP